MNSFSKDYDGNQFARIRLESGVSVWVKTGKKPNFQVIASQFVATADMTSAEMLRLAEMLREAALMEVEA